MSPTEPKVTTGDATKSTSAGSAKDQFLVFKSKRTEVKLPAPDPDAVKFDPAKNGGE